MPQRSHEHGFNERFDVGFAGVVRAKLRAKIAFTVESAFKQRAHDARLDKLPVRFRRVGQPANFIVRKLEHCGILEQVSVEMADLVFAKTARPWPSPGKAPPTIP